MGRKAHPTALRIIKGNPTRRPLNKQEPKPQKWTTQPPERLSEKALSVWEHVEGVMQGIGVLAQTDAAGVELLCEAYADYLDAREELKEFGSNYYTTTTRDGGLMYRTHPAMGVIQDADRRIRAWLVEYGMTPSSRSKIKAHVEDDEIDPAEEFFKKGA